METLEEHDTKITRALPSMDELLKRADSTGSIELCQGIYDSDFEADKGAEER